jgi:hypothetical protein
VDYDYAFCNLLVVSVLPLVHNISHVFFILMVAAPCTLCYIYIRFIKDRWPVESTRSMKVKVEATPKRSLLTEVLREQKRLQVAGHKLCSSSLS